MRGKENVMNREDVNWSLQTIKDPENAKRLVLAQYELGRISLQVVADVARERDWINRTASQFLTTSSHRSTAYATTGLTLAIAS
jgi:hypothetical protein